MLAVTSQPIHPVHVAHRLILAARFIGKRMLGSEFTGRRLTSGLMIGALILNAILSAPAVGQVAVRPASNGQTVSGGDLLVLKFKAAPRTDAQVVRVGDLVDVVRWGKREAPEILDMPLAPAPAIGQTQEWTSHELMRQLMLRGMPSGKLQWSGAESVSLTRVASSNIEESKPLTTKAMTTAYVEDRLIAQAEANLVEATRQYIWLQTGERTDWHITLEVPPQHAAGLAQRRTIQSIAGGAEPWVGPQDFTYVYKFQDKTYELELTAEIETPRMVVVTSRPIRRDEVIDESALAYAALPDRMVAQASDYFEDFDQVVGKQLRSALSTGLPVPKKAVGAPIVISSGELIEIESVSGSVSVKTSGRALSGGAVGDLVNVELLSPRKRLTATVVDAGKVRISGSGMRTDPSPLSNERPSSRTAQNLSQTGAKQAQRNLEGIRR